MPVKQPGVPCVVGTWTVRWQCARPNPRPPNPPPGPPVPTAHWSSFIKATLDCGAAKVTGHVWVNGQESIQITGKPITVRLSRGEANAVHEHYARALWTLYVNPSTYLPIRMVGVTETFGGSGGHTRFESVTNVRWLPPTSDNVAQALVTIPPGYQQVSSPADQ